MGGAKRLVELGIEFRENAAEFLRVHVADVAYLLYSRAQAVGLGGGLAAHLLRLFARVGEYLVRLLTRALHALVGALLRHEQRLMEYVFHAFVFGKALLLRRELALKFFVFLVVALQGLRHVIEKFVDLGGIDGLLHITDLAWRRVRHPSEVVSVGQEIEAKVLKFDQEKSRVSLGLKQLGEDPWIGIARRYPQNTRLFGKVTNITDYGAFVEIETGIEGLVHVSEMDWTNKNVDPKKIVQLGEEVEVMVLDIDEDRRRISLGMKQCKANPWEEFNQSFKKGDKVKGQVKSITDFGVFIGLPGGIDGLVHLSDLSWNEQGEDAVRKYKKGDELEAVVLGIDTERERISLGIKQLSGDPFTDFAGSHERNTIVKGTVKSVDAKGAVIDLGNDTEGYLRASEISSERVEDATTQLTVGQEVEALITSVDRKNRSIQLSIKAKDAAEARKALDRVNSDASSGTTNLGALLKAKLEQK